MKRRAPIQGPIVLPMKNARAPEKPARRYAWRVLVVFAALVIVVTVQYLARAHFATEKSRILYRLNDLRREITEAKNQSAQLGCQLAELQRPDNINRRLAECGIRLSVAPVERVIRMKLPQMVEGLPTNETIYRAAAPARPFGTLMVSTRREQ